MTDAPTALELQKAMEIELREGLQVMTGMWELYVQDGSRWPVLLAKLHAMAFTLAEQTERLADQLAAYAKAHPHGQLPPDPWEVPVAGYTAQAWREVVDVARNGGVTLADVLHDMHRGQLAGPGPHAMVITHPRGPDVAEAVITFTDPTGRTVLVVYYGTPWQQVQAEFERHKLVATTIPYVPAEADAFLSIGVEGNQRNGLYDRYGRYVSP